MRLVEDPPKYVKALPFLLRWIEQHMDFDNRVYAFEATYRLINTGYCCAHHEVLADVGKIVTKMAELNPDFVAKYPFTERLYELVKIHIGVKLSDDTFSLEKGLRETRAFWTEIMFAGIGCTCSKTPEQQEHVEEVGLPSNKELGVAFRTLEENLAKGLPRPDETTRRTRDSDGAARGAGERGSNVLKAEVVEDLAEEILAQEDRLANMGEDDAGDDDIKGRNASSNKRGRNVVEESDDEEDDFFGPALKEARRVGGTTADVGESEKPEIASGDAAALEVKPAAVKLEEEADHPPDVDPLDPDPSSVPSPLKSPTDDDNDDNPTPTPEEVEEQQEDHDHLDLDFFPYSAPPLTHVYEQIKRQFVDLLQTLFSLRDNKANSQSMRTLIDPFFQELFYVRNERDKILHNGFSRKQVARIEDLQATIKKKTLASAVAEQAGKKNFGKRDGQNSRDITEGLLVDGMVIAQNPVIDARALKGVGHNDWGGGANW
eukprot:g8781.t1